MAELQIYQGVKMHATGDDIGLPPNSQELQRVFLWDIGPEQPTPPQRPALPTKGLKPDDPLLDLEKLEFSDRLARYETDLREHAVLKAEFSLWQKRIGGPLEYEFWSCDAEDALARDRAAVERGTQSRRRWYVSSRTRGSEKLPNRGLPEGMSPGHGQAEMARQRAERDGELEFARRRDPVFGAVA